MKAKVGDDSVDGKQGSVCTEHRSCPHTWSLPTSAHHASYLEGLPFCLSFFHGGQMAPLERVHPFLHCVSKTLSAISNRLLFSECG